MTKNPLLYGVLLLVLAVFVTQCCFTVHQTQQALVLQLGDPLPEIYRPGLHFKLPFIQKVVYFDARVLDYAASSREAFTVDKKTIVLDNYARWRISDPLQFYRTMRTIPGAQARLDDVVYSQLRALVGAYTLTEVVSKERATIMTRVTEKVSGIYNQRPTPAELWSVYSTVSSATFISFSIEALDIPRTITESMNELLPAVTPVMAASSVPLPVMEAVMLRRSTAAVV